MKRSAAIYARISSDDGLALGVARQEADCRQLAEVLKWSVYGVYADNDTSAFTGRVRPSYQRMLADLEGQNFNALICWDVDRLTRNPIELEHVIELAERLGIALASVGGEIDLATPQGRLTARIKASVARHEVEQSSRRIKRKVLERAELGLPHGRATYGWRREQVYDDEGRRLGSRDVVLPAQAEIVREAAERIVAGESIRSISLDFEARRVPSPTGLTRWHPVTLRQLILRERNIGLRVHQRNVLGKGAWEPILADRLFHRACAILRDPARRTSPGTVSRHLLSGIALCGLCGGTMRAITAGSARRKNYACSACFRITRKQEPVDRLITKLVVRRLAMPDAATALSGPKSRISQRDHENLAVLRSRLDAAADQYAAGSIDGTQLARITARLRPQVEVLSLKIRSTSASPDLLDLAGPDIENRWDSLPLERKRAIISALLTVTIMPIGKTGRAEFDPRGVRIDWKKSSRERGGTQGPPG